MAAVMVAHEEDFDPFEDEADDEKFSAETHEEQVKEINFRIGVAWQPFRSPTTMVSSPLAFRRGQSTPSGKVKESDTDGATLAVPDPRTATLGRGKSMPTLGVGFDMPLQNLHSGLNFQQEHHKLKVARAQKRRKPHMHHFVRTQSREDDLFLRGLFPASGSGTNLLQSRETSTEAEVEVEVDPPVQLRRNLAVLKLKQGSSDSVTSVDSNSPYVRDEYDFEYDEETFGAAFRELGEMSMRDRVTTLSKVTRSKAKELKRKKGRRSSQKDLLASENTAENSGWGSGGRGDPSLGAMTLKVSPRRPTLLQDIKESASAPSLLQRVQQPVGGATRQEQQPFGFGLGAGRARVDEEDDEQGVEVPRRKPSAAESEEEEIAPWGLGAPSGRTSNNIGLSGISLSGGSSAYAGDGSGIEAAFSPTSNQADAPKHDVIRGIVRRVSLSRVQPQQQGDEATTTATTKRTSATSTSAASTTADTGGPYIQVVSASAQRRPRVSLESSRTDEPPTPTGKTPESAAITVLPFGERQPRGSLEASRTDDSPPRSTNLQANKTLPQQQQQQQQQQQTSLGNGTARPAPVFSNSSDISVFSVRQASGDTGGLSAASSRAGRTGSVSSVGSAGSWARNSSAEATSQSRSNDPLLGTSAPSLAARLAALHQSAGGGASLDLAAGAASRGTSFSSVHSDSGDNHHQQEQPQRVMSSSSPQNVRKWSFPKQNSGGSSGGSPKFARNSSLASSTPANSTTNGMSDGASSNGLPKFGRLSSTGSATATVSVSDNGPTYASASLTSAGASTSVRSWQRQRTQDSQQPTEQSQEQPAEQQQQPAARMLGKRAQASQEDLQATRPRVGQVVLGKRPSQPSQEESDAGAARTGAVPAWKQALLDKKKEKAAAVAAAEATSTPDPNMPAWKQNLLLRKRQSSGAAK